LLQERLVTIKVKGGVKKKSVHKKHVCMVIEDDMLKNIDISTR